MKTAATVLAIALGLAPALWAQALDLPTIRPDTPLQPLETPYDARGWEAIGRLESRSSYCTGTLIAPDLVLTAAHCLYLPGAEGVRAAATRIPDAELLFRAGYRHGTSLADRQVRRTILHPEYDYGAPENDYRVRTDIALLELARPIADAQVRPLATRGQVRPGDPVQVVSYGRDREEFASLEDDCSVLTEQSDVLVLSCSVINGSSGAPVMVDRDGQMNIVSVVSAMATWGDDPVALSAGLEGELVQLLDLLERREEQFIRSLPQIRTLGGADDGRDSVGARFVRP